MAMNASTSKPFLSPYLSSVSDLPKQAPQAPHAYVPQIRLYQDWLSQNRGIAFEHYKDLEPGKWVKVDGWYGPEEAGKEIMSGVETYKNAASKPNF
jgi:inorganic pyrophosphatase